jgi:putative endonuclease
MFYIYALSSIDRDYIYVGITNNLLRRIVQHSKGFDRITRPYLPFFLIYSEICKDRRAARKRGKYWKSGIGKEKLKMIREGWE